MLYSAFTRSHVCKPSASCSINVNATIPCKCNECNWHFGHFSLVGTKPNLVCAGSSQIGVYVSHPSAIRRLAQLTQSTFTTQTVALLNLKNLGLSGFALRVSVGTAVSLVISIICEILSLSCVIPKLHEWLNSCHDASVQHCSACCIKSP